MKFEQLIPGTLFQGQDGLLYVKLANNTAAAARDWRIFPFTPNVGVNPIGKLRPHSRKLKLKLTPYQEPVLR